MLKSLHSRVRSVGFVLLLVAVTSLTGGSKMISPSRAAVLNLQRRGTSSLLPASDEESRVECGFLEGDFGGSRFAVH